ncbi:UNVERIFIED_CONTAM: hypothetical protein K2H54_003612 [Gekko kuhli]
MRFMSKSDVKKLEVWYIFEIRWESQLLETGFLGIFLCPLWTLSRLPKHTPPSRIVIWGYRWLIFRIMLGARPIPQSLLRGRVTPKYTLSLDDTHFVPGGHARFSVCKSYQAFPQQGNPRGYEALLHLPCTAEVQSSEV